ncbi:GntR family transcriptional regulator [Streptomyces sp. CA-181903]|uniref:GntR family transcriptional regulator n=1 Tax=Streptomyces sp. CA-181903 TaxID=3240055 RepID=UPI003D8B8CB6
MPTSRPFRSATGSDVGQVEEGTFNAATPLYLRIKADLEWGMQVGAFAEGSRLPAAGELGEKYGANKNTVLRALRLLRSEGMIDFGRGRPAVVIAAAAPATVAAVYEQLRQLVDVADRSGVSRIAIIDAVRRIPLPVHARTRGRGSAVRPLAARCGAYAKVRVPKEPTQRVTKELGKPHDFDSSCVRGQMSRRMPDQGGHQYAVSAVTPWISLRAA